MKKQIKNLTTWDEKFSQLLIDNKNSKRNNRIIVVSCASAIKKHQVNSNGYVDNFALELWFCQLIAKLGGCQKMKQSLLLRRSTLQSPTITTWQFYQRQTSFSPILGANFAYCFLCMGWILQAFLFHFFLSCENEEKKSSRCLRVKAIGRSTKGCGEDRKVWGMK